MKGLILIVEDEALLGRNLKVFLTRQGFQVEVAETVTDGRRLYDELHPDVVLLDHNLPDGTGLSLIEAIRSVDRFTKLVLLTAYGGVELAVDAMKRGADDYLTKPVSLDEIGIVLGRLAAQARRDGGADYLRSREQKLAGLDRILGTSPPILEVKRRIRAIAAAERAAAGDGPGPAGPPVLILGETGSGKELVARALHFDGPRASAPFVSVNCAALPEHLVEAELFGHERGAFTGANEKRAGLFQAADGGTLFLDEVGELPLLQQAKLLRVLEDAMVRPVGSTRARSVDVRIVAATNMAVEERVRMGEFRNDLFYRLAGLSLELPPLRARGSDILAIAEGFVAEYAGRYGRRGLTLADGARTALLRHSWPGNIRELRNVIQQACLLAARNVIDVADLSLREPPPLPIATDGNRDGRASLPEAERSMIVSTLRRHGGNVTLSARDLGITRDTLRYRMEKFDLHRRDFA